MKEVSQDLYTKHTDGQPIVPLYNVVMPTLSNDQVKAAIADGDVFAISIDTAVFDAKQKNFQDAVLLCLDQFHQRGVRVVIADVVANEMKTHLRDDALETQKALKKALRSHNWRWKRKEVEGEQEDLLIKADADTLARVEFDAFLENVNGEVIKVSETPEAIDETFKRYFLKEPPFGAAIKRKYEFPDAFSLIRLEAFAMDNDKLLMCVSPDKGWIEFAAQSKHLICEDNLEDALALFNAADQHLADAIDERWHESESGELIEEVSSALEYRLDDLDFSIDAQTDFSFEAEPLSAVLQHVSTHEYGSLAIIAVDGETLTFTVEVEAIVDFEASFSFYAIVDKIDKDYVDIGSVVANVEKTLSFDLTIRADRSLENGLIFHEVEVTKKPFEVDFGYIEAFQNEDPTYEKY